MSLQHQHQSGWLPDLLITPTRAGALELTDAGHAALAAASAEAA